MEKVDGIEKGGIDQAPVMDNNDNRLEPGGISSEEIANQIEEDEVDVSNKTNQEQVSLFFHQDSNRRETVSQSHEDELGTKLDDDQVVQNEGADGAAIANCVEEEKQENCDKEEHDQTVDPEIMADNENSAVTEGAEDSDVEKKVTFAEDGIYSRMECHHVICDEDEEEVVPNFEYKMNHPKRGIAVIFNNGKFSSVLDLPERVGYKEDGAAIKDAFSNLGFEVRYYQDLTIKNIVTVLQLVIMEGQEDADCLTVVFMTHGQRQPGTTHDVIFGKDGPLWVQNVVAKFTADNCPSLAGKPKLFFVEASRGTQVDPGIRVSDTETDASRRRKTLPLEADLLISQSTVSGYTSFPSDPNGSTYIRSLARTLVDHGRTKDIHWLLTRVNSLVAAEFESTSVDRSQNRKRQMPVYTSTLTKILTFPRPANEQEDEFFLE